MEYTQIKLFQYEDDVNRWLKSNCHKIKVIDIKFSGEDKYMCYIMVIYSVID